MSSAEATGYNRIGLLTEAKLFQLYDLDVLHLVNLTESYQLSYRGQLAKCEEIIVAIIFIFVNLCSEAPHKVFLWAFDQAS